MAGAFPERKGAKEEPTPSPKTDQRFMTGLSKAGLPAREVAVNVILRATVSFRLLALIGTNDSLNSGGINVCCRRERRLHDLVETLWESLSDHI